MDELAALLYDPTFISILTIALSALSIGASVTTVVLTKKTNERDNARIARSRISDPRIKTYYPPLDFMASAGYNGIIRKAQQDPSEMRHNVPVHQS